MKNKMMTYAMRKGILTSISEVEKGLKCNCTCPACGSVLTAHKGSKITHHFKHYNSEECRNGYEISLYMLAKKIIEKEKVMMIPKIALNFNTGDYDIKNQPAQLIEFDSVELENRFDNIIPDILLHKANDTLIIEFFVTHKIDNKIKKINKSGISTIGIDLSKIDKEITEDELKKILLTDNTEKHWIFNKKVYNTYQCLKSKAKRMPIIERGLAIHVDDCPLCMRCWHGKFYANFLDDCGNCQYFLDQEYYDYGEYSPGIVSIYCLKK